MMDSQHILKTLQGNRPRLSRCGVSSIGLFGSYLRGEQTGESDIDLLVDFELGKENFDNLMQVYDLVESLFQGYRVELVTRSGLSTHIGPQILQEVEYA